jgi:hypothetical protein
MDKAHDMISSAVNRLQSADKILGASLPSYEPDEVDHKMTLDRCQDAAKSLNQAIRILKKTQPR